MLILGMQTIALLICVPLLAYFIVKWAFTKDTEKELRRKSAAKLAATLTTYGLRKTPEFLLDYSVGDWSGMANKIHKLSELFEEGEQHIIAELDEVYKNVLDAKLKTEEGRALISAKLATFAPKVAAVAVTATVAPVAVPAAIVAAAV